jgi:calcium-dependent protein kinase
VGDIVLGEGMTSCVKICTKVATGQRYALKTLQINRMDPAKMQELRDEITIMKGLDHPHIVRLYDVHEEKNKMYLVMEYCEGGELFDRLFQQEGGKFTECKAAQLVQKMLASIHFMHTRNICHRDLKLENFIFEDQTVDSQLKLIDFGLSHRYTKNENMRNILGTSYYMAPEVLKQEYNNKCDLWSIGVIT